uniref:Uncharacterized protein n=1 Tax=viral metagenome TaxID=1070528 RepID=A0A6C0KXK2_9ZZZZ|tara:strand:+ start:880 stop:1449 length:570 start_codon:yes stop_codon:yes gene_type:complete
MTQNIFDNGIFQKEINSDENTPLLLHNRKLEVDVLRQMFNFKLKAYQNKRNIEIIVNMKFHDTNFTGIKDLIPEINRIIRNFLCIDLQFKLIMIPDIQYPFKPLHWEIEFPIYGNLLKYGNNNPIAKDIKACLYSALERENEQICNNWHAIYNPTQNAFLCLMRIQNDLRGILNFDEILEKFRTERKNV